MQWKVDFQLSLENQSGIRKRPIVPWYKSHTRLDRGWYDDLGVILKSKVNYYRIFVMRTPGWNNEVIRPVFWAFRLSEDNGKSSKEARD